jgi:hypothetical protein
LVEEADLESARALIADTQDVPGYKSLESDGFEKNARVLDPDHGDAISVLVPQSKIEQHGKLAAVRD